MGTRVEVRVVGALEVRGPGAAEVGGTTPRTLLALLAVRRRRLVTADQIAEVLWGARPPGRPDAGISTMVSRLRRVLGAGTIDGDRNGYRLGDSTWVDLSDAAALIEEAEAGWTRAARGTAWYRPAVASSCSGAGRSWPTSARRRGSSRRG